MLLGRGVCAWAEHQRTDHAGGGQGGVRRDRAGANSAPARRLRRNRRTSTRWRSATLPIRKPIARRSMRPTQTAMRDVVAKFPDDLDAATLFAQSLMDTSPWNYWNADGSPRAFTNDVLSSLESVLKRKTDHPGAIHLYIHAVEASPDPNARSSTPIGCRRSCRAPDISCTCRGTSTCAPAASTTRRRPTRTPSRSMRRIRRAIGQLAT